VVVKEEGQGKEEEDLLQAPLEEGTNLEHHKLTYTHTHTYIHTHTGRKDGAPGGRRVATRDGEGGGDG
jgi:hypothetical protein